MFARIKGRVRYNIRSMFLSTKNKSVMLQIITLEEKQKYHITFFCEKNKSIILHHVLPNSCKQHFLAAFVILIEESFYLIARKGK